MGRYQICSGKSSTLSRLFCRLKYAWPISCVCAAFLLSEPLFTFNKSLVWTVTGVFFAKKDVFFLANKCRSPCLACFYEGLKWCIPQRETLQAATALCPSVSPLSAVTSTWGFLTSMDRIHHKASRILQEPLSCWKCQ